MCFNYNIKERPMAIFDVDKMSYPISPFSMVSKSQNVNTNAENYPFRSGGIVRIVFIGTIKKINLQLEKVKTLESFIQTFDLQNMTIEFVEWQDD